MVKSFVLSMLSNLWLIWLYIKYYVSFLKLLQALSHPYFGTTASGNMRHQQLVSTKFPFIHILHKTHIYPDIHTHHHTIVYTNVLTYSYIQISLNYGILYIAARRQKLLISWGPRSGILPVLYVCVIYRAIV